MRYFAIYVKMESRGWHYDPWYYLSNIIEAAPIRYSRLLSIIAVHGGGDEYTPQQGLATYSTFFASIPKPI